MAVARRIGSGANPPQFDLESRAGHAASRGSSLLAPGQARLPGGHRPHLLSPSIAAAAASRPCPPGGDEGPRQPMASRLRLRV